MANFITDGASALPPAKQNSKTPTGSPVEVASADMNALRQALLDTREVVIAPATDQTARDSAAAANQAAIDASAQAASAAAAAALKNKTFYQPDAPGAGMGAGDLWYDTNDSYKMYRYNGPGDSPPSQWAPVSYVPAGVASTAAHTYTGTAVDREAFDGLNPGTLITGDIWFTSDAANRAFRWNGGAWVDIHDSGPILSSQIGQIINTAQLVNGAVSADSLGVTVKGDGTNPVPWLAANAIGTQHLIANAVTAGKIAAGAIQASSITVSNWDNLWPNGNSEIAAAPDVDTSLPEWKGITAVADSYSGLFARRLTGADSITLQVPCSPGEAFYIEAAARVVSGVVMASIGATFSDKNGIISGTSVLATQGLATWALTPLTTAPAPAGTVAVNFTLSCQAGGTVEFDAILVQKMVESQLIVDGAIIGRTIQAGAIRSDHIAANTITAKNLTLTDFTNLFPNSDGNPTNRPSGKSPTDYPNDDPEYRWATVVSDSPTGFAHRLQPATIGEDAKVSVTVPAGEGESFYIEAKFRLVSGATGNYGLYWKAKDKAGTVLTSNWTSGGGAWTVRYRSIGPLPAATSALEMYAWADGNRVVDVTQIWFRRRMSSALIVDGAITASKIFTGAVTADAIQANAVDASKITVSDTANLWPNGFSDPEQTAPQWPPTGSDLNQAEWIGLSNDGGAFSGNWYRRMQMPLNNNTTEWYKRSQAKPGDDFRIEAMVKCTPGDSSTVPPWAYVYLRFRNAANTILPPFQEGFDTGTSYAVGPNLPYTKCTYWAVAPSGTVSVDFSLGGRGGNTSVNPAIGSYDSIYCHRRTGGELIVDGSISTNKLNFTIPSAQTGGQMVASINADAGGLTIAANRITLSGNTQFVALETTVNQKITPGEVNENVTYINGGAIQTGTVSAARLDLTSRLTVGGAAGDVNSHGTTIDGGKITADTITATQIAANAITATEMAADLVTGKAIRTTNYSGPLPGSGTLGTVAAGAMLDGTPGAYVAARFGPTGIQIGSKRLSEHWLGQFTIGHGDYIWQAGGFSGNAPSNHLLSATWSRTTTPFIIHGSSGAYVLRVTFSTALGTPVVVIVSPQGAQIQGTERPRLVGKGLGYLDFGVFGWDDVNHDPLNYTVGMGLLVLWQGTTW